MLYNNRHYPHPVLGIEDDIEGKANVRLKVSSNSEKITLESTFILENNTIEELIKSKKACFSIHLTCPGTFFRSNYISYRFIGEVIEIPADQLNGGVEVDYFVCANADISGYTNINSNEDYGDVSFDVAKGDILAYLGKGKFYANKAFREVSSVSSFMNVNTDEKKNHPFFLDYGDEKITVTLSQEDYELYLEVKMNRFASILHSALVLPALQQVLYFMSTEESKEYSNCHWYNILEEKMEGISEKDHLKLAQIILDQPLKRSFSVMQEIQNM